MPALTGMTPALLVGFFPARNLPANLLQQAAHLRLFSHGQ